MTATLESPAPQRPAERTVPWLTLFRFVIVAASVVFAFWNVWVELIEDVRQESDIGYIFALPALAAFAALGMALRRRPELPIYDRQTDIIVGLLGLASTAAVIGLLVLRYPYEYEVLHLDLLAIVLFAMSVSILMFGLRPVFRFWPVWLLSMLTALPLLYRMVTVALGGTDLAEGVTILIPAAAAAAIGAGRTRLRALAAALTTAAVGALVLTIMTVWFPDASLFAFQMIPPIVAVYASTTIMFFHHRGWATVRPLDRPILPHTAKRSWSALGTVVVATVLVSLVPVPKQYEVPAPLIDGLVLAESPALLAGWNQLSSHEYPWAPRYFGPGTVWSRLQWQASRGNPLWDKESRRRRIVVDVVRSGSTHDFDHLPEFTLYRLHQPRVSPPLRIDLGHGVVGRLNTVIDDRQLLSWTWLSWTWRGVGGAQRISLIAADNHLPDANFPQPEPSTWMLLSSQFNQILRGNAVVLDPESKVGDPESEYKDRDMLTTVAQEIVRIGAGA